MLGFALMGCAVGPDYHPPQLPAPSAFAAAPSASIMAVDFAQWWRVLDDPLLDRLVEQAVRANPDLDIAVTRLRQAEIEDVVLLGGALPQINGAAGAAAGSGSDTTRGRVPPDLTSADNTDRMPEIHQLAGFDAVWELDLFGQYRRAMEAGRYDRDAAAEARNVVLVTVIADVVQAYIDLRGQQMKLAVLRENLAVAQKSRDFVKLRFVHGLTNELDLTLAERELAALQAEAAPLVAQISAAQNTIAALLGGYPETLTADLAQPRPLPALPEKIQPGLPLDLIKRRPDIRESERLLAAATARTGIATANLFPRIAVSGSIGAQFSAIGVDSARHIWSLGPSAYWPLLDFGALDALVDIADLQTHVQLEAYRRAVLNAVRDVDTALSVFGAQQDRVKNLGEALMQSRQAVMLASERYDRGLTDYLNVVDAERQLYVLEAELVTAQQTAGEDFVAAFKSLGGGWEGYQQAPPDRLPQPALVAMFERLLNPPQGAAP